MKVETHKQFKKLNRKLDLVLLLLQALVEENKNEAEMRALTDLVKKHTEGLSTALAGAQPGQPSPP
jgi:hypothetical protein